MKQAPMFKVFYAVSFAWQLGFLIIFPILGFGFLGSLLDGYLGLHGTFIMAGFIFGVFVAIYETVNMVKPMIKKHD